MADNVTITPGTGADIGADEISGVKYQRVKLIHGADGTNDGDVATANPLPVVQTGALPAGTNAIGKLAANSGVDIGDVDVASCALPTGAATSAKQDTGNSSLSSIDGKMTACNTGAVVLAAGTAAIGKLAANSGVDIGDVDVISCALPTGAATAAKQPALGTAGTPSSDVISVQGVASGTVIPVSDGGGALTVDGTITANLSATDNAVLDDIAANQTDASQKTQIVDGSGNVIGATSNALDVNIKSGSSSGVQYTEGDTNASITGTAVMWEDGSDTLRSVSAAKPLPVNIISGAGSGGTASDDDADFTAGTTAGTPAMGVYESSPSSITDGDMGIVGVTQGRRMKTSATIDAALPAGTNAIGKLAANSGVDIGDVDVTSLPALAAGTNEIGSLAPSKSPITDDATFVKKYYTNSGAVTDGVVWSPAAGKRWYVTDMIINVSAAATVTLEDDLTGGDSPVFKAELAANGGLCKRFATPLASGEDAADLLVTTSAGNVYITITGYEV